MAQGISKLIWLKRLLSDLGITLEGSMKLHSDDKPAIFTVHNPIQHYHMRHVLIDRNSSRPGLKVGR